VSGTPTPPRLGRLLVERGLIDEHELEHALARSAETGRPLGDTLLDLDLVPPNQITDLLAVQRAWRPLGWMLVERGLITEEQLTDCLDDGEATGRRLGEVVGARGLVPPRELDAIIAEQYQLEVELERGFGNGLRGEIERRYRLKRAPQPGAGETGAAETDSSPAQTVRRECKTPAPAQRNRSKGQTDEIQRLRDALVERDATILALRRRLGEADAVVV
jgi:hypothetical protein